jgi:hypothetical protein
MGDPSGGVAARRRRLEQGLQAFRIPRSPELFPHLRPAQETRNAREGLQMVCSAFFRREQKKDEVRRPTVHGVEIMRWIKSSESPDRRF